jgi:hypothetical protein
MGKTNENCIQGLIKSSLGRVASCRSLQNLVSSSLLYKKISCNLTSCMGVKQCNVEIDM